MAAVTPDRVAVRAYQVGFGDCLLVSFHYPPGDEKVEHSRHVLIDFGSTRWPVDHRPRYTEIAQSIAERTGGRLDAIVVTHRHKDHLAGFGDATAGAMLAELKPRIVVRPWTEDPAAEPDATGVGERSRRFADDLGAARVFVDEVERALAGDRRAVRGEARTLASFQLANQAAIDRLDALASAGANRPRYLRAGQASGLSRLLPGVTAHVLGPPTVEQWPAVTGRRADDPEYWLGRRGLLEAMLAEAAVPGGLRAAARAPTNGEALAPGPTRWLIERLRDQHAHALLRIVRTLDDALNNTSLILLFEVGQRRLLFPGDAQIENWSYALTHSRTVKLRALLPEVDLYKIGHHGSRNATPKSLVAKWERRGDPVSSIVSTLPGVHGHGQNAVPKASMLQALERLGPLFRTDTLAPGLLFRELNASTADRRPFREM